MEELFLYVMAIIYILAGLIHFWKPQFYRPMMPPYIPAHNLMIFLSGVAEVILGLGLLWPVTRVLAAWGVIALLIAISPAHIFMLQHKDRFSKIPIWALWLRLPLQILLMAWAFLYI